MDQMKADYLGTDPMPFNLYKCGQRYVYRAFLTGLMVLGLQAQAAPFAYIANDFDNSVSVVNIATNLVVDTIPVGANPASVTINSAGTRLYVVNAGSEDVSVIDTATNAVISKIIILGRKPGYVVLNTNGTRAYVTTRGYYITDADLSVIDTSSNSVIATIPMTYQAFGLAINPTGTRVYFVSGQDEVFVVDTATNALTDYVPLRYEPLFIGANQIAVNLSGTRAYVATTGGSYAVAVIDTITNTVVARVLRGAPPYEVLALGSFGIVVNPAGTLAYTANRDSSNVSVIDTTTNTITAFVALPLGSQPQPNGIAMNPAGTFLYVASAFPDKVYVISTSTNAVVATIPVGAGPIAIGGPLATVPSAPTITAATPMLGQETISFSSSTWDGDSPIISYTVTAEPGGILATSDASPITVSGLTNGTTYTFTVTATNAIGRGRASAPLQGVTVGAPSAPTSATAATSAGQVTVTFAVPAFNGGSAITGYTVISTPPGGVDTNAGTLNTSHVITNLDGGTAYTFRVTATNVFGTGVPSAASNSVVPGAGAGGGPFAFVTNSAGNTVSVLNTASNGVVATIPVGTNPYGVAVNAAGTFAYVTNQNSNNVSVISASSYTVIATVPVGTGPLGIAVNPAGTFVYVANLYSGNVSVINAATNSVVATISVGPQPTGIAINPAGTFAYVTSQFSGTVAVIDTAANTVVATIPLGGTSSGVAFNPAANFAYVGNTANNSISVINLGTNTVIATTPAGTGAQGIAVTPAGTFAYVANASGNSVSVINTLTNAVITAVPVGTTPIGVAVNHTGSFVYVVNRGSNNVSVIDTSTNIVVATVQVGISPNALGNFISPAPPTLPGTPTGTTATGGAAQATVTFTPPVLNGGSVITGYTVISNPAGGVDTNGSTTALSHVVTGLTNGVTYTFSVVAINAVGVGAPSTASNSVTPLGPPGIPVGVTATAGNGLVTIAFAPPGLDGGSPILGYSATCLPGPLTTTAIGSPITVTGLANDTTYTCSVTASNASGTSSPSALVSATPNSGIPLALIAAQSRKLHGAAGSYALAIDTAQPGLMTIEPRTIGAGHQIVFQFNAIIMSLGSATATDSLANPLTASSAYSGNEIAITLPAVPDMTRVTISLVGVNGTLDVPTSIGFLVGDVNGSRSVTSTDVSSVKARSGQTTNSANFKFDLNASGAINVADIFAVKTRIGRTLP